MKTVLALLLMLGMSAWGQGKIPDSHSASIKGRNTYICYEESKLAPEPMDVPAVEQKRIAHPKGEGFACGQDWCIAEKDIYESYTTCADKRRVLLTDESDKNHCILFPKERP